MKTLQSLKKQIDSTEDFYSVVKTMKTLAAVSIRQYEDALESIKNYNKTLDLCFQVLLQKNKNLINVFKTESFEKSGLIVIGSEQGMSGRFNEEIAEFTRLKVNELGINKKKVIIAALGKRVGTILNSLNMKPGGKISLPGSVKNFPGTVQVLVQTIENWRKSVDRIFLFYNMKLSGSDFKPTYRLLFPLDINHLNKLQEEKWSSRCIPQININQFKFLSALIREYFFVMIFRGLSESLAAENASRLAAMQAAEKNIEDRMEELNSEYNHLRQNSITAELLDIVSGTQALNDYKNKL